MVEEPEEQFWRLYGGGDLLATYYLLRECLPQMGAFDPANLLILTSSVVAGQPYAGLARHTAVGQTYYRLMGWDDAGRPRYETLPDHHLEWVVDEGHLLNERYHP